MITITKRDLVQRISEDTGVQQQKAKEVIQGFLDQIIQELATGNRLEFRDFGVFEPKAKAPRTARNPRTGERIQVPEKVTVKFKAGRMMKQKMQPAAKAPSPEPSAPAPTSTAPGNPAPGNPAPGNPAPSNPPPSSSGPENPNPPGF